MKDLSISRDDKTALIFGATGLVGGFLVELAAAHPAYNKIRIFTRREVPWTPAPGLEVERIDFDRLDDFTDLIRGDDLFLCLGTTMNKAGSKKAFRRIDLDYSLQIARIASSNLVNQVLLVSSVGADRESLFFYSRVKGELEDEIRNFNFWSGHIFQPSVLLGDRPESRLGERWAGVLGRKIDQLTGGMLKKYRPIEAEFVARAMIHAAQSLNPGWHIYPSHLIQDMSKEWDTASTY